MAGLFFALYGEFFAGGFGKRGGLMWCFCGQVVVIRVVNVVKKWQLTVVEKKATNLNFIYGFELYFYALNFNFYALNFIF